MNKITGELREFNDVEEIPQDYIQIAKEKYKELMGIPQGKRVGSMRNLKCPCGKYGKKFKHCCMNRDGV